VGNESFDTSRENLTAMFTKYVTLSDNTMTLYNDSRTNDADFLANLQVPVIMIYGSHLQTYKTWAYDNPPNLLTGNGEFATPSSVEYSNGDETVPVAASLIGGAKWAWEFDNMQGQIENLNPVKIVEYCSTYNNRSTVYDEMNANESYKITKNEYIGLGCTCMTGTDEKRVEGGDCDHADSLEDPMLVTFLQNIVNTNESPVNIGQIAAYNISEQGIANLMSSCPNLYASFAVTDPMELLGFVEM